MPTDAEQKIDRRQCWVDARLHHMAKEIAAREQTSISEVIERELDAPLTRRYRRMFPETHLGENGAG